MRRYGWIKNRNKSGAGGTSDPGYLKSITGSSFALLMDESSGDIVDEIASVTLTQYNAANTYSVTGFTGYDPGITMNPVAGGFKKGTGIVSGLGFGTGDGNIFLAMRVDGAISSFSEIFITTVREVGNPGFSIRGSKSVDAANSIASIQFVATDLTTVTVSWAGNEIGDAIFNGGFHTWEFKIDRSLEVINLYCDDVLQTPDGSNSIAALAGKSLDMTSASAVGVGCDYRAGIDRNIPITVNFIRVKQTL